MRAKKHINPHIPLTTRNGLSASIANAIEPPNLLAPKSLDLTVYNSSTHKSIHCTISLSLIENLNQQRIKLHKLEELFSLRITPGLTDYSELTNILRTIDNTLMQISYSLLPLDKMIDPRMTIVEVMTLALAYWHEDTHTDKIELARASGLWNIYTNTDGWSRTQTMNRYLSLETLPTHPRRRQILRTAEYVLTNCHLENETRLSLEHALAHLRNIH